MFRVLPYICVIFNLLVSTLVIAKYQGIPEQAPPVVQVPVSEQAPATQPRQQPAQPTTVPAGGPNANPLDLFPQVVVMYTIIGQSCKDYLGG